MKLRRCTRGSNKQPIAPENLLISKFKPKHDRTVSLARALSKLGFTSRQQAIRLIQDGRVTVNGILQKNPAYRCDLSKNRIAVDSVIIPKNEIVYIAMNKPIDVVTTRSDELDRKTVYDLLGDVGKWVFPIGRLDKETSGLLLFTNDTRFGERLTNPISKIPKTYRVELNKPTKLRDVEIFEQGMILDGEHLLPAKVKKLDDHTIELTIVEGKNRQIRRMCTALGYAVSSLERIKIGKLDLRGIACGMWRYLSNTEVDSILACSIQKTKK